MYYNWFPFQETVWSSTKFGKGERSDKAADRLSARHLLLGILTRMLYHSTVCHSFGYHDIVEFIITPTRSSKQYPEQWFYYNCWEPFPFNVYQRTSKCNQVYPLLIHLPQIYLKRCCNSIATLHSLRSQPRPWTFAVTKIVRQYRI